jgi:oligopeptide transport system permease protein
VSFIRSMLRGTGIALGVVLGIILLSGLSRAFQSTADASHLYIYTYPGRATLEQVVASMPNTRIADAVSGLVEVPQGQADKYRRNFILKDGIRYAMRVSSPPRFSFAAYRKAVVNQVKAYANGDFGVITMAQTTSKVYAKPLGDYLELMLKTSLKYFIPGLLTGIAVGYICAFLGAVRPGLGRFFDVMQGLLMGIPDFFVVVLLQLLGIYLVKWTGDQVFKILQYNEGTPFVIPFTVIAIFPALLVYGTMKIGIEREWGQNYVLTAYAKGLSYGRIVSRHILRNTAEDVLAVLPKAVTVSLAGMAIAEALCHIVGIGGYYINPKFGIITTLPATCIVLGGMALVLQFIIYLLRLRFTVRPKEAA